MSRQHSATLPWLFAWPLLKLEENNRLSALDFFCITGVLALSAQLRPIKGVLSIALEARRRGRQSLIVPVENAAEVAVVLRRDDNVTFRHYTRDLTRVRDTAICNSDA